jgi:ABC-2 type transport system permease protein
MSHATFADAVRSEWTKLRSLRSTVYTLLVTAALALGFSALFATGAGRRYHDQPAQRADFDPTAASLQSFFLVQLAVSALGVLAVTSEYTTGMIRTSLAAVPRRGRILTAKALVFGLVALVVGQVAAFGAFLVGQTLLAGADAPNATLGQQGVLRAVVGCGLYLAVVGLLGVAVGVLVRATAGGIMIMVAVTLLIPLLTPALPEAMAKVVGKYWPTRAGSQVMSVQPDANLLSPWAGFGVLCAWVLATLAVAFAVFRRRDA